MGQSNQQASSYSTEAITHESRQSWVKVLSIWVGLLFSSATMIFGSTVGTYLTLSEALIAIVLGTATLAFFTIIISNIGADTGLSSYQLMKYFLGNTGGRVISVMFVLVMLGWSGINAIVVVDMFALYSDFFASPIGFNLSAILFNIICIVTIWTSFKGLSFFSRIAVPIIAAIFVLALVQTERIHGIASLFGNVPVNPQPFIFVVSSVVALWINAPLQAPDLSRFSRSRKDTIIATSLAFVLGAGLIMGVGAITSSATGLSSIPEIYTALDIGGFAIFLVLLLAWTSSSQSMYSSALAFASVLPIKRKPILLMICLVVTSVFTFVDIFDYFLQWVNLVGLFFCPVLGLFIGDYYFFRAKYKVKAEDIKASFSIPSLIAIAVGIVVNILIPDYGMFASIPATMLAYWVLNKFVFKDKVLEQAQLLTSVSDEVKV